MTRIVNWPPTAVLCVRIRRQSSRIHVHTADATRQNSFVSSASAVCIGLKCLCVKFIREDLEHSDGGDIQAHFHGSDDLISVHELWQLWISSAGESVEYCDVMIELKLGC